jgi:hypothetical protein
MLSLIASTPKQLAPLSCLAFELFASSEVSTGRCPFVWKFPTAVKPIVSVVEGKAPRVIKNSEGARTVPSVVAFIKHGEHRVGLPPKRQAVVTQNTVFTFRCLTGRQFGDKELKDNHENDSIRTASFPSHPHAD